MYVHLNVIPIYDCMRGIFIIKVLLFPMLKQLTFFFIFLNFNQFNPGEEHEICFSTAVDNLLRLQAGLTLFRSEAGRC